LRERAPTIAELHRVQERREFPTRLIQNLQMAIQNRVMTRVLNLQAEPKPPFLVKLLNRCAYLRRLPAWLVGIGFRPEHVRIAEHNPPQ
jgi:hypothetical protein